METSIPQVVTSEGTATSKHEIGVLFVHGIGQQHRGETLLSLGEPLCDWIRRWVEGAAAVPAAAAASAEDGAVERASGKVSFDTVLFEPMPDQAPAHAVLRIEQSGASHGRPTSWLLAEAFWADSFPNPSFPQVVSWTMSVSPWVFGSFI